MPCYRLDGLTPVVHPSAYVHPSAVLIGDVLVGPNCYIGPLASLRGDFGRIILEEGANLQDTCVMHGFPGGDTVVERNGHIGHGAVLHGCRVGEDALVGMNAVVMDGAHVAPRSIVAATAFVKAGFQCPQRSLVVGAPATVKRSLSDQELAWKQRGTAEYHSLARRCMSALVECPPLSAPEAERPRMSDSGVRPKAEGGA
ncbi:MULTISPECIES: phenylacetic acid degradation protein PaaY [unclassified Pseudomonas]|uniref:phenylacetic acid degradation protein PaaY n=1 Tax=unclassified Pseudomonas TaxID=196821 RepID=UPI00244CE117|nr:MULTISPECIES: phenylacetic acid degradation protein PaaY [unclassified Pseudomonas]MDH0301656.1 phenylacetic acid degradation protein PaaY [Pseudomonas sp. GD04091]MDH1984875.1 phenylacetic acid degradation protein PaaY [Pseudomonas sp. GD03689]